MSVGRFTNDKELRALIERVERVGWSVSVTSGNRFKILPPEGNVIFASATASEHRALRNIESQLRRAGLEAAEALLQTKAHTSVTPDVTQAPAHSINAVPRPVADPYVLNLMKLGRLIDRLQDPAAVKSFSDILKLANEAGLTFEDLIAAFEASNT